jgi:hypothetical protein
MKDSAVANPAQGPTSGERVVDIHDPVARRIIAGDWLISMLVNTLIIPAILWGLGAPAPRGLAGANGVLADAVRSTVNPMLMMTVMITAELRLRRRAGKIPFVHANLAWLKWVPESLILRCVFFIVLGNLVLAPLRVAAFVSLELYTLTPLQYAISNALYGIVIGLTFSHLIILPALTEKPGSGGRLI